MDECWSSLITLLTPSSDQEARDQFETNFIAPLRLIRTALPAFRARNAGTIVNLSSVAGLDAHASTGLYASSKFALEGISGHTLPTWGKGRGAWKIAVG